MLCAPEVLSAAHRSLWLLVAVRCARRWWSLSQHPSLGRRWWSLCIAGRCPNIFQYTIVCRGIKNKMTVRVSQCDLYITNSLNIEITLGSPNGEGTILLSFKNNSLSAI